MPNTLPPFAYENICPGPSSQSTSSWSFTAPSGHEVVIDTASLNVSSMVIKAPTEKSWADIVEQILQDRAHTWEQLAAL